MKVLHVITNMKVGGAQKLLADLLPIISKQCEVSLLVLQDSDTHFSRAIVDSGIKIISLNFSSTRNPLTIFKLRHIFKSFDIVHVHLFPTVYWAAIASVGLKVKMVYTEHSTSNHRRQKWYFRPIDKLMYQRYDGIISISAQTEKSLKEWLEEDSNRFSIINNGVDIKNFKKTETTLIPNSLIMISRFAPPKDQDCIIKALTLLPEKVSLLLVGGGARLDFCKEYARQLGVSHRVSFLGIRSEIPELIASSYIGIQSSKWEGFGLTAVEIMASGKPVVATNVEGLRQVVDGAGLLFDVGDYKTLAHHVNKLIEDKGYYQEIAGRCIERSAEYDISIMSDRYYNLYTKLLYYNE